MHSTLVCVRTFLRELSAAVVPVGESSFGCEGGTLNEGLKNDFLRALLKMAVNRHCSLHLCLTFSNESLTFGDFPSH